MTLPDTVAAVKAEREQKIAEKLREEIDSVRKIQETFIPKNLEAPAGYRVAARYEPSQIQVVGGAPVTPEFADQIGADGYAPDAGAAVDLARGLLAR